MQTIGDLIEHIIDISVEQFNGTGLSREAIKRKILKMSEANKVWHRVITPIKIKPIRKDSPLPRLNKDEYTILSIVAEVHGVEITSILSRSRKREVAEARMHAMYMFYTYLFYTYARTGAIFNRDHSTIIHAVNTTNDLFDIDASYSRAFTKILENTKEELPHLFDKDNSVSTEYKKVFSNRKLVSGIRIDIVKKKSYIEEIQEQKDRVYKSLSKSPLQDEKIN
jgi:hypothetical protein